MIQYYKIGYLKREHNVQMQSQKQPPPTVHTQTISKYEQRKLSNPPELYNL